MDKFLENEAVSSIVNDGIRVILNLFIYLFFFLQEGFTRTKSTKSTKCKQATFLLLDIFYVHKKHKKHKTSNKWFSSS